MRSTLPALLLTVLLISPTPLAAQSADAGLRDYVESLETWSEAELKRAAENRDRRKAGFALLELHRRVRNQAHAARAARLFAQEIRDDESEVWARYGLATVLTNHPRAYNIIRVMDVTAAANAADAAVEQLRRSLRLAPDFAEAETLLSSIAHREEDVTVKPLYDGATPYFTALAAADDATLDKFVEDLAIIATSQEMLTVTQGSREKRVEAVRLFWKKRAVRDGVSQDERIREHFRRLDEARQRFDKHIPAHTVLGRKRQGWEGKMDDRGLIFVRYGEPHLREYAGSEVGRREDQGLEVWVYLQPDGRYHTYYFIAGRLEADPLAVMGYDNTSIVDVLRKYDARYAFVNARSETARLHDFMRRVNPDYAATAERAAGDLAEDVRRQNSRIVERNRRMLFMAFDADAAPRRFGRQLPFFYDLATFRGHGCTDIIYSVAAPGPNYRLTMAVADTFTWEAQTVDTVIAAATHPGQFVRGTGVFCARPDHNSYVRMTAAADSSLGATAGGELRIPDYSGHGLLMSDILLADTAPGALVRGSARLALVPPRQFEEGEPFRVFYELYNLPAGRAYRTEITLVTTEASFFTRLFKGKSSTRVTFEGVATGDGVMQELRTFIPQVEAGEAELSVKVTDLVTGESAKSRKKLWISPSSTQH